MKLNRIAVALISSTMLLLFAPAYGGGATARAEEPNLKLIRIMITRSIAAAPILAIGPFAEKYGLRTEVIPIGTNAEMLTGLRTGSAEIGQLGLQSPAILAEQNVGNVKIIAGFIVGAQNLITRKAAAIHSWKDLEGKKIGLAPGTYAAVLFTLAARENNVDISKINLINTTASGTVELQALKNGDLDGFVLYSPIIDRAVIEGFAEYPPCCDIGSTKKFGSDNQLFAANADFLKDRTTVVKLLKAYVEAEQYYIANSGKALDITGQYTGVPKEVLVEAMKHFAWDHRVDLKAAVSVAQEGPTFGFTKADMSGKVPAYFDLSFLSEATGKPVNQLDTFGH